MVKRVTGIQTTLFCKSFLIDSLNYLISLLNVLIRNSGQEDYESSNEDGADWSMNVIYLAGTPYVNFSFFGNFL